MSSGTRSDPDAARRAANDALPGGKTKGAPPPQLSPRQQLLSAKWSFYTAQRYMGWKYAWDGTPACTLENRDMIAHSAVLPDGFNDAAGATVPVEYRAPDAPYAIGRLIVQRFSGLLFGEKKHPTIKVPHDEATEDYLGAIVEAGRLWAQMHHARNHGGGMGSVAVGFVITDGQPAFEVHDGRWCTPTFKNRFDHTLRSLEKRVAYPLEEKDPETGEWEVNWYWYRRLFTETSDTVWDRIPVGDGTEPAWAELPCEPVEHALDECQVVWIQNTKNDEGPDGDTDCHGAYETIETLDRITSAITRGTRKNTDPTLLLKSELEFDSIGKGSDQAIQVETTGDARYIELAGTGIETAMKVASLLEDRVCRSARVVLERSRTAVQQGGARTATEAVQDATGMHEQVGVLREQYGQRGVLKVMRIALRAIRKYLAPTYDAQGQILQPVLLLPPREIPSEVPGQPPMLVPRALGPDENPQMELAWPPLTEPTLGEIELAVRAASMALEKKLVDAEHASQFVAPYFAIEDVKAMLAKMDAKAAQVQADADAAAFAAGPGALGAVPGFPPAAGGDPAAPPGAPSAGPSRVA